MHAAVLLWYAAQPFCLPGTGQHREVYAVTGTVYVAFSPAPSDMPPQKSSPEPVADSTFSPPADDAGQESPAATTRYPEPAEQGTPSAATDSTHSEYLSKSQLSVSPQPLTPIHIPWPPGDALLGRKSALFTLFIDETGAVNDMVADAHSLSPAMEEIALQTFKEARFSPGLKNGLPVKAVLRIAIEFEATPASPQQTPQIIERKNL